MQPIDPDAIIPFAGRLIPPWAPNRNANNAPAKELQVKNNRRVYVVDDGDDYDDGKALSYSGPEISEEELQQISNYFTK